MKATLIAVAVAGVLIVGAVYMSAGSSGSASDSAGGENVFMESGVQIVQISARGGYSPRVSGAKADLPTILRMNTEGTFDCSSALVIPSLGLRKNLPPSGVTDIELGSPARGTSLRGLCAMGMYNFTVNFN